MPSTISCRISGFPKKFKKMMTSAIRAEEKTYAL
jgi:hypothetical protein